MSKTGKARRALALLTISAAASVGGALPVGTAGAETLPPNLDGEILTSSQGFDQMAAELCHSQGDTTLNYTTSGVATGPYSGTFTETWTAVLRPNSSTATVYYATMPASDVVALHASYTIASGGTTITGTKDLLGVGVGVCAQQDVTVNLGGSVGFTPATVSGIRFTNLNNYEATVNTGRGPGYRARGIADIHFEDARVHFLEVDPTQNDVRTTGFTETFFASTPVEPLPGPATVTLSPADDVNPVGTSHTVAATVTNLTGGPVANTTVSFQVSGATSTTMSCQTDATGTCSASYMGPALPGADLIIGFYDANANGSPDSNEPQGTATKAWILPTATSGQATGGGQFENAARTDNIAFGFTAKSDANGVKGGCTLVDPSTGIKIKCADTTTLVRDGSHATLFGHGTVSGAPATYRIDVDDNAEPGRNADTFRIQTDSGYTAGGTLTQGNIQIH